MQMASVPKIAKALELSPATVRSRIEAGIWPCYRLGRRSIRLDLDEIRKLTRRAHGVDPVNQGDQNGRGGNNAD